MSPDEIQITPIIIEPSVVDETRTFTAVGDNQTKRFTAVDQPDGSVQIIAEAISN